MAGRVSAILRHQVEIAEEQTRYGETTSLREARENLVVALALIREQLQPLEWAASRHDIGWLAATYPDWVTEKRLLRDELQSIRRLLEHIDLLLAEGSS